MRSGELGMCRWLPHKGATCIARMYHPRPKLRRALRLHEQHRSQLGFSRRRAQRSTAGVRRGMLGMRRRMPRAQRVSRVREVRAILIALRCGLPQSLASAAGTTAARTDAMCRLERRRSPWRLGPSTVGGCTSARVSPASPARVPRRGSTNARSSVVGARDAAGIVLVGASGVFGELQSALNRIWEVKPKPGRGIKGIIRDRFFSFAMVMGVAFLLLVTLVVSAGLAGLTGLFKGLIPFPALWEVLTTLIGIGVTAVLFALIFKARARREGGLEGRLGRRPSDGDRFRDRAHRARLVRWSKRHRLSVWCCWLTRSPDCLGVLLRSDIVHGR